jgi:hypothetical protein
MAYDEIHREIVLFGGLGGVGRASPPMGDTWCWDGSAWRLAADTGPTPRDHVRMAWSDASGTLVLFGGFDGDAAARDTWSWDGSRWTRIADDGPSPRAAHAMARDPTDGAILLFGGRSLERFHGDTWRWDGRRWTLVERTGPSSRAFHGMAPSDSENAVLLFGGWEGAPAGRAYFDDSWAWCGSEWRRMDDRGPAVGGVYAMVHESTRRAVVLHGGGRKADGTAWHLERRTWLHRDGRWREQRLV